MMDNAREMADHILRLTGNINGTVLEIGCGDGRITGLIHDRFDLLVAVDPVIDEVVKAKESNSDAEFTMASGVNLPFRDSIFDLVIFSLSLHHQDSLSALNEAGRVVKEKGRILVVEPAVESEFERLCFLFHDEKEDLINARSCIFSSGLIAETDEIAETRWTFENNHSLHEWLANFYGINNDEQLADQVAGFLGAQVEESPLVISDDLRLTVLSKTGRN